jgi:hypothetical protein
MCLDARETGVEHVVDSRAEAHSVRDVGRARLELVGKLVPGRPLHRDGTDHLATEVERRHRLEQLAAAPESADPARPAHLVRRDREELAVERLDVDRSVRRSLRGVDHHDRAALVRPRRQLLHGIHRAERVRDQVGGDHLDGALALDLVERVEAKLARLVDRDGLEGSSRATRDVLPRDEARVVLEIGHDYEVARAEVVETPGVRDEIQRLGRTAREDHLAFRWRVHESSHFGARRLVSGRRALGEPVDATVDVRIRVLVVVAHRVEHLARLLRRSSRVEECDRLAVDELRRRRRSRRADDARRALVRSSQARCHRTLPRHLTRGRRDRSSMHAPLLADALRGEDGVLEKLFLH